MCRIACLVFFNDTATTEIYTLSLHDALPIFTVSAESFRSQYLACYPDVVVLDLALPRSDGVELLRFLAEEKCAALVLPISGFDERVLEAAMRLGTALGLRMTGPLQKPVRLQQLMDAMQGREAQDAGCIGF